MGGRLENLEAFIIDATLFLVLALVGLSVLLVAVFGALGPGVLLARGLAMRIRMCSPDEVV